MESAFTDWLKESPRSNTDKSAIKVFRKAYPNRPAEQVDNGSIAIAMAGKAPGTYNRTLAIIRAALNLAASRKLITVAPKLKNKKTPAGIVRYLTVEQYKALRAELPAHLLAPFEFSLATGQRRSNVLQLRWDQVDLKRKFLRLDASVMKSGEHHGIPLGEEAMAILRAAREVSLALAPAERSEFVFLYRGAPIKSPKTAWDAARVRAKLPKFRWHDLRHTWASWMAMSGAPLTAVKEGGAWASMDMVARYSHLSPKHLAAYADGAIKALREDETVTFSDTVKGKKR